MTATEMLLAGLNAALRRPIVNGPKLRENLIKRGIIKPQTKWEFHLWSGYGPGGYFTKKVLIEENCA